MYIPLTEKQKASLNPYQIENDERNWNIGKTLIGFQVCKRSRKPFKSGKKTAHVKDIVRNPNTNLWAASFFEDDSVVDIKQIIFTGAY